MELETTHHLIKKVAEDYNKIATEFSATRKYAWPEFDFFKPFLKPNGQLLDLGCGNGRLFGSIKDTLQQYNINYTGLDISHQLLSEARQAHPEQNFIEADISNYPLPHQHFDQIWAIASFHHIPTQKLRIKVLKNIEQSLKPGGIFIMTNWNLFQKKYVKNRTESLLLSLKTLGKHKRKDLFIDWNKSGINRYYHAFTPSELTRLIKQSGLELVDQFYTRKKEIVSFKEAFNICSICRKK